MSLTGDPGRRDTLPMPVRAGLALVLAVLPACVQVALDPRVFVETVPPGASVLVDGVDTGFHTPAVLDMTGRDTATVSVRDADGMSRHVDIRWTVDWRFTWSAASGGLDDTPVTPFDLSWRSLVMPVLMRRHPDPQRIFVRWRVGP